MLQHLFSFHLLLFFLLPLASCDTPEGPAPVHGKVKSAVGWKAETIVSGLEHPWAFAWLPDGSILITERPGRIRSVKNGILTKEGLRNVPSVLAEGQGGLLDLSLHPQFSENQLLYFTFAAGTAEANRTTLARAKLKNDELFDFKIIFQNSDAKPSVQHFGSRILWLPDNTLLISIGDGGNPPISLNGEHIRRFAQDRSKFFGKVLRLNHDGTVPKDNPFVDQANTRPEIFTYGHRNIQGLAFDSSTKTIWANEHGSRGGDELNILRSGKNYGWPVASYSQEYWGGNVAEITSAPEFEDPVLVWTPSPAPSGLVIYTGNRFPDWKGDLLSGCLAGKALRRIDLEGQKVIGEESLDIGKRVRDVKIGPDGELYILTDEKNGELLRIIPAV